MTMFQKLIDCDVCGYGITANDIHVRMLRSGDLEVQYFSCPVCHTKYQILTTDRKMRKLIERRKAVQMQIKAARAKKFKERAFKKYLRENERIKKEQEKMLPSLEAQGEKLLKAVHEL